MNRRAFLKRAGLLAAAAVVVPKVLFAKKPHYVKVVDDPDVEFKMIGPGSKYLTDPDMWYLMGRRTGKTDLMTQKFIARMHSLSQR